MDFVDNSIGIGKVLISRREKSNNNEKKSALDIGQNRRGIPSVMIISNEAIQIQKSGSHLFQCQGLTRIALIATLNTQTFFVEAAVTVHSPAYPTFLNCQNVILLCMFTACHTGKFFRHNYTPLRPLSLHLKK
jgi:hypothetical protein